MVKETRGILKEMKSHNQSKASWQQRQVSEIAALRAAVERDPKDAGAHHRLGATLLFIFDDKATEEGIKHLNQAIKLMKDFPDPVEVLADYAGMTDPKKAIRLYKKAAELFRHQGDEKKADELLNRAATIILDEGWEARESGDNIAAKKKAIRALEIYPYCVDARSLLGNIYTDRFEFHEAEKVYRAAVEDAVREQGGVVKLQDVPYWLEIDTRPYMRARHGLGLTLMQLHRYDEALKEFEILMDLNPNDNQGIRFLLPDAHHFLGDLEKAEKLYEEHGEVDSLYGYSLLLYFSGKQARAEGMLKKAVKGAPFIARILRRYLKQFDFWKGRGMFKYGDVPHLLHHMNAIVGAWNEMTPRISDRQSFYDFESAYHYCNLNAPLWLKYEGSPLFLQKAMEASGVV
jgi:tetratricopeptide (TPR) repeat protein